MSSLETLGAGQYLAHIPGGRLHLWMECETIPLPEALGFAARRNPRRRFLFVSRLLGRHLPARPAQIRGAAAALAAQIQGADLASPILFIGMAETATTLGQAVYREWIHMGGRGLYLDTTRRRTGAPVAFEFNEAHSHAPGHLVHLPGAGDDPEGVFHRARSLVIVDDEVTTGLTAAQLLAAYETWLGRPVGGHLAVLVHWRDPTAPNPPLQVHSLLAGRFEYEQSTGEMDLQVPPAPDILREVLAPRGTRHGVVSPGKRPPVVVRPGSTLVIGGGEHGFIPLQVAEALEAAGGEAYVQATTRSPVLPGGAIGHVRAFPAISGEGYTEYLYNVPGDHQYDRVLLCREDRSPLPEDHPLRTIPRLECLQ